MNHESAFPPDNPSDDDARSIVIKLEAHDASRFEWRVGVPLPMHPHSDYTVQAEFELPSTSILRPSPWEQLRGFTRLEEPEAIGRSSQGDASVHLLRQQVLVLQRARQGLLRHCRLVSKPPEDETAVQSLITWLNTAFRALATARARAVARNVEDSAEMARK